MVEGVFIKDGGPPITEFFFSREGGATLSLGLLANKPPLDAPGAPKREAPVLGFYSNKLVLPCCFGVSSSPEAGFASCFFPKKADGRIVAFSSGFFSVAIDDVSTLGLSANRSPPLF